MDMARTALAPVAPPMLEATLPGWFGKLPGMGDFAHRRLPPAFRNAWDAWLQDGLAGMRQRHADWAQHYLQGPLWHFALAQGVAGPAAWVGVLMPSVDGVGRYFPFTVARPWSGDVDMRTLQAWWAEAGTVALAGLEQNMNAERFDTALADHLMACFPLNTQYYPSPFDMETDTDQYCKNHSNKPVLLPQPGHSLWLAPGQELLTAGLPQGEQFDRLFDCAGDDTGDAAATGAPP